MLPRFRDGTCFALGPESECPSAEREAGALGHGIGQRRLEAQASQTRRQRRQRAAGAAG